MTAALPVESPRSLGAAIAALAAATPATRLVSGGTDLMVELHSGRTQPDRIVDLHGIDALRGIRRDGDGLRLGALTTCTELLVDPLVGAQFAMLRSCSAQFGAVQIRNRATLGGNLGTASPASDLLPVLLALEARVRLHGAAGARDLPVAEFVVGYRQHAGRPGELIESVWLPSPPRGARSAFRKVGPRAAQAIAKVVVALAVTVQDGVVTGLRGAAGAVAEKAVLLPSLRPLVGSAPTAAAIAAASRAAALQDCAPIDDVRSTAQYRRHVLQRVLQHELEQLLLPERGGRR